MTCKSNTKKPVFTVWHKELRIQLLLFFILKLNEEVLNSEYLRNNIYHTVTFCPTYIPYMNQGIYIYILWLLVLPTYMLSKNISCDFLSCDFLSVYPLFTLLYFIILVVAVSFWWGTKKKWTIHYNLRSMLILRFFGENSLRIIAASGADPAVLKTGS